MIFMDIVKSVLYLVIFIFVAALSSCTSSNSEQGMGIEQARYSVIEKQGNFEIRQYQPCIVAETIVESDFDGAGNKAFRRLFNYISGQNHKKQSIAMTAPVDQKIISEKISMTAPVNQQKSEDKWVVSFLMPSKYTIQTLPEPLDPNVILRVVPARKIAALRYSGIWSKKRYEGKKSSLVEFINERSLKIIGEDIFARYDPPFQIFFLRRNEVLIPVE